MKQRISALLDLPKTYIVSSGACSDFFASLIMKYSKDNINPPTTVHDLEFNNTAIEYPQFFRQLYTLSNTVTRAELEDALVANLTEYDVTVAESYMADSVNPVFAVPSVKNELFSQHPTYVIMCKSRHWLDYTTALSTIKFRRSYDQVPEYYNFVLNQVKNNPRMIHPYSADDVQAYMTQNGIERVAGFRLRILFSSFRVAPVPNIDEVFSSSLHDLFNKYRYFFPVQLRDHESEVLYTSSPSKKVLYLEDVVTNTAPFVNTFNITDFNCYKQIKEWHTRNLEVLNLNEFTEFDDLYKK